MIPRKIVGIGLDNQHAFAAIDQQAAAAWGPFGKAGATTDAPFKSAVPNFYMTCPISRSSRVMADCTALRRASLAVAAE